MPLQVVVDKRTVQFQAKLYTDSNYLSLLQQSVVQRALSKNRTMIPSMKNTVIQSCTRFGKVFSTYKQFKIAEAISY